jgi:hypothetical protein
MLSGELTQTMLVFSRKQKNNNQESKEWRSELAYRSLLLLRTAVAVVEYESEQIGAWEVSELSGFELDYVTPKDEWRRHAQTPITKRTDSMRVPFRLAYLLRETICSNGERLKNPLVMAQEMKLLGSVDSFLNGYYG